MLFKWPRLLNTKAGPPLAELSKVCIQDLGSKALSQTDLIVGQEWAWTSHFKQAFQEYAKFGETKSFFS